MKVGLKNCQPLHNHNQVAFKAKSNKADHAKMQKAQTAHKGKLNLVG